MSRVGGQGQVGAEPGDRLLDLGLADVDLRDRPVTGSQRLLHDVDLTG